MQSIAADIGGQLATKNLNLILDELRRGITCLWAVSTMRFGIWPSVGGQGLCQ